MSEGNKKIGIMGGTFDPIHRGHLLCAEQAREQFNLDRVIFVTAGQPALKDAQEVSPAKDRHAMVELAVANNPYFEASRLELDRSGTTYTVDTLREMTELFPDDELFFITGSDAVFEILSWKEADKLAELARFIAVARPGYNEEEARSSDVPADVEFIEAPALDVSSSELRQRFREGHSVRYLVPETVEEYVHTHHLYVGTAEGGVTACSYAAGKNNQASVVSTSAASMCEHGVLPSAVPDSITTLLGDICAQLEQRLDDYGYRHSISAAETARTLALLYQVDPDEAYLAALLHDWDRCIPKPELIEQAHKQGFSITPEVLAAPQILHAHTGAVAVRTTYPQLPERIISAIAHHTVGTADMSDLSKIVYIADMLEPTRTNPNITVLREMIGTVGLDALFVQAYQKSMLHLVQNKKVMHPATTEVWNALVMQEHPVRAVNPTLKTEKEQFPL